MAGEKNRYDYLNVVLLALTEWAIFTFVFAVAGAWPAPDVNEGYYLAKARHSVNPEWCESDFFLQSGDAHGLFFLILGPLAASATLSTAAWVGRWAGWLALAVGFRHAIVQLSPSCLHRLFAITVFSLAARYTTMAGEWMIGGCEAKVFAWALVLGAWGESVRGRWAYAWLLSGAATAFHPLVGGWMMIAIGFVAIMQSMDRRVQTDWLNFRALSCVIAGLVLALCGVWPAMQISIGVAAGIREQAAAIYVVDRLPHHLLPGSFQESLVTRHLLAVIFCGVLYTALPYNSHRKRGLMIVLAAVLISCSGFVISLCEPFAPYFTYGLLRFYWFRLADGLVPLGLCVLLTHFLFLPQAIRLGGLLRGRRSCLTALILCFFAYDSVIQSRHWPLLANSFHPRSDKLVETASWSDVCQWVQKETPPAACFLTPRGAASFLWRAQRSEVVAWKNVPQDPISIVEWRDRVIDCFSYDGTIKNLARSTCSLGMARLNRVANTYNADFIIAPLKSFNAMPRQPRAMYRNKHYVVIEIPIDNPIE